ncbi:restriction endonuclease subunit S [Aliarcobacter cryaerophilus]|uniref:restriction endonuclease subunit S n=1 Tax=Aliarcobacter cryaerophilus TaxID=28198 RepID=UPI003DA2B946
MKFETYDSYKDSEIEWLGEIPNGWNIRRVKDLTFTQSGTTPQSGNPHYYDNGETYWIRTTDLNNNEVINSEYKITEKAFEDYSLKILPIDSVLIAMYGGMGTIGKNGIVKTKATLNQSVCAVLPKKRKYDSKYFQFYLQYFRPKWELFADSARKDPNINQDAIKNLFLCYPNLDEQKQIANYLDIKTLKIDKEISILEQKIEKYKELKQTLIAETVLRGLDKNIELRDSETQWIGDIPKHWETDRLKNIFNERADKNLNIKTGEPVTSNILSVMKDIGVINHRDKGNVGNKMAEDITNYKLVYPNDIVVNKMNVMIGSVGISKEFGALSVVYIILITKKDSYAKYYDYFFRMKAFQRSLRRIATGILEIREAVNMTLFMQEMMTKPPYDEQVKIANYLDEKTSKIDSIVEVIGKKIEVLKEFRKTLINDVVTGKVKVA